MITYNTFKYAGKFDKKITITTGEEGTDETSIHLMGYVDPIPMGVIALEPRKVDIGELSLNRDNPVSIVINNTGDADLTVSRIVSQKFDTVYFDAAASGDIVIAEGMESKIDFAVHPTSSGRFLDTVLIYSDARNDIGKGYKGVLSGQVKEGEKNENP